jgi:hypothetical protein
MSSATGRVGVSTSPLSTPPLDPSSPLISPTHHLLTRPNGPSNLEKPSSPLTDLLNAFDDGSNSAAEPEHPYGGEHDHYDGENDDDLYDDSDGDTDKYDGYDDNYESKDEGNESHGNNSCGGLRKAPRRGEYLRREHKLNHMVRALKRVRWKFSDFIIAWAGTEQDNDLRIHHRKYHKHEQRRAALHEALDLLHERGIYQAQPDVNQCILELNVLITKPFFNRFDPTMDLTKMDYSQTAATIQDVAPTWYALMMGVMSNRRAGRQTYPAKDQTLALERRLFTITSMVCFSRARNTSNHLSSSLDLYLLGSGVHRRVIEVLSGLGICHSYHHANSLMNKIADNARVCS